MAHTITLRRNLCIGRKIHFGECAKLTAIQLIEQGTIPTQCGVDWRCVKDAEKEHLAQKYRNNSLKGVTAITIDEMYLFPHERSDRKYMTIVRDAVTGRVLSVTRGKGVAALKQFTWWLKKHKGKIGTSAMQTAGLPRVSTRKSAC